MFRRSFLVALVAVCLAPTLSAAAPLGPPRFYSAKRFYLGEQVILKLRHDDHFSVKSHSETWDIVDADGDVVAQYYWTEDQRQLAPHQYRTWVWDQRQACYGACQNVWEGDLVEPGRYRVRTTIDGEEVSRAFSIGSYFHLGFDGAPDTDFVVFTYDPDIVLQMRAELARPVEERQIVAGTVRLRSPGYNGSWTFVLDPPTIFLGEVFIEVCDGSARYVENHRQEWRGQQWCPWSSYVESEGL